MSGRGGRRHEQYRALDARQTAGKDGTCCSDGDLWPRDQRERADLTCTVTPSRFIYINSDSLSPLSPEIPLVSLSSLVSDLRQHRYCTCILSHIPLCIFFSFLWNYWSLLGTRAAETSSRGRAGACPLSSLIAWSLPCSVIASVPVPPHPAYPSARTLHLHLFGNVSLRHSMMWLFQS